MTNNPTIDGVSRERELFEKFTLDRADRFHPDFSRRGLHPEAEYQNPGTQGDWEIWQGRALLDAPVVERQPVAFIQIPKNVEKYGHADQADRLQLGKPGQFFANGESPMFDFVLLYTAPPQVAALQSTIAQLEDKLNKAINLDFQRRETIAGLQARIAELESGMVGGILFPRELGDGLAELIAEKARVCGAGAFDIWEEICERFGKSPPSPVAVVLPERKETIPGRESNREDSGWNACLDAIAALNGPAK